MPQKLPAVPLHPTVLRRGLVLACAGLALCSTTAAANAGGGAEAGDPSVAQARTAAPAPTATAAPSRTTVRAVQRRLRQRVDGVYGPRTRAAVRRFQRKQGLRADGRLSPETLSALGVVARAASAPTAPAPTGTTARLLDAIAQCESGGDPTRISPDGRFRGKYQFLVTTWEGVGGQGDPAAAPEVEQDRRAASLMAREGTKPWPVCGRKAKAAEDAR